MSSNFASKKTTSSSNRRPPATQQLSQDQIQEVREAFELFDMDKDGRIDFHELKVAMRALGFDLKKAEVLKILRDASSDAHMSYEQFHRVSESVRSSLSPSLSSSFSPSSFSWLGVL